ncbi:MAG: hypothetical protein QW039_05425 [Fervidicoccaceae archaeon]
MGRITIPRELLNPFIEQIKLSFKNYNRMIESSGYYLKPVHYVTKISNDERRIYMYLGRYWWKIIYVGRDVKGRPRIKWIYMGKERPRGLPEPPKNPLEGLAIYMIASDRENYYFEREEMASLLLKKLNEFRNKLTE